MNLKSRIIPFALLALAVASSFPEAASPRTESAPRTDDSIRALTFNIRYGAAEDGTNSWTFRRGLVVRVIAEQQPDLLGLQEALRFQLDELGYAFPEYHEVGSGRDDGKTSGEYSALLVRQDRFLVEQHGTFWFSNTPEIPGSTSWGNRIPRVCTWALLKDLRTGQRLRVFNLHLDHQSQESRLMSVRLLAERIRSSGGAKGVIVMGDFNAGESNPVVRFLKGEQTPDLPLSPVPLVDTFRSVRPDARIVGTFNGFTGEANGEKIDFVFTSGDIATREADIIRNRFGERFPSDHFPVSARLRLPPR